MTWLGVPWVIGSHPAGDPVLTPEATRSLAYLATGGKEGPAGPGDAAVVPLDVPAGAVMVRKGTVGILNRFPGGFGQAYVAANDADEQVAITATGTGGGRTDLIAVIIEDPQYPNQPVPVDAANGPYVRTVVYEGVSANVRELSEVAADQSGYALARVTLPVSTGTVQAAHITDLRDLPAPRSATVKRVLTVGEKATYDMLDGVAFEPFPDAASWIVDVPKWATLVQLELRADGLRVSNDADAAGTWQGRARLNLGGMVTAETTLAPEIPAATTGQRFGFAAAAEVPVPTADRGGQVSLEVEGILEAATGGVEVREALGATFIAEVRFIEAPSTDAPESFY